MVCSTPRVCFRAVDVVTARSCLPFLLFRLHQADTAPLSDATPAPCRRSEDAANCLLRLKSHITPGMDKNVLDERRAHGARCAPAAVLATFTSAFCPLCSHALTFFLRSPEQITREVDPYELMAMLDYATGDDFSGGALFAASQGGDRHGSLPRARRQAHLVRQADRPHVPAGTAALCWWTRAPCVLFRRRSCATAASIILLAAAVSVGAAAEPSSTFPMTTCSPATTRRRCLGAGCVTCVRCPACCAADSMLTCRCICPLCCSAGTSLSGGGHRSMYAPDEEEFEVRVH